MKKEQKKVITKPKTKALNKAHVICRAFPDLRFRIDNFHGRFYPMVQTSFISWGYINYDALHDGHSVNNSHSGCSTRKEALEFIERYKAFKIAQSERDNCEYL